MKGWSLFFFNSTVMTGSFSASLCAVQHIMGTWPNSLPSPETSARCVILFESSSLSLPLSVLSLFLFSLSRLKAWLCALLVRCLFGLRVWDRLSWEALTDSCTVSSLLLHSQPPACLPACLEQPSTHKGLSTLHYFGHKVTGNQWREVFFFFWKREVGQKVPPKNLVKYFSVLTLLKRENIVGFDSEQKNLVWWEGGCTYLWSHYSVFETYFFLWKPLTDIFIWYMILVAVRWIKGIAIVRIMKICCTVL